MYYNKNDSGVLHSLAQEKNKKKIIKLLFEFLV